MRLLLALILLAWSSASPARAFDPKAFAPAWELPWQDDWVTAVAFAGPNRLIAGNERGSILLYELPEKPGTDMPRPIRQFEGHTNGITKLLVTPDAKWLLSASKDKSIRLWNLDAAPTKKGQVILDAKIRERAAKKTGGKLPPLVPPAEVLIQPAERVLSEHTEWINGFSLSADGATLLSGDDAGNVLAWDRPTMTVRTRWKTKGWIFALAASPDGKQAVVTERIPLVFDSGRYAALKVWNVAKSEAEKDLTPVVKEAVEAATYSPDGKWFAVGRGGEAEAGKIWIFESDGFKKKHEMTGHLGGVNDLRFTADSKHLVSCGRDTLVRIWNVADGKQVSELGKSRGGQFKDILHAVALSSDERWIAAGDMAGMIQVWHAK
jgi:WD40 repeat protein